ncbi:hypothetical protein SAMN04488519_104358 [Algoriphagus ornithinivorans]|uniref:Uncharacterized protein n=1 Tax=Algoriphagus ornithinivorans TaxID=226506 RepID=A0A1I5FF03_9BACT|nr:hypothetical protein SAMN04488519_104358 [Algoriphagus ornithinivorans]
MGQSERSRGPFDSAQGDQNNDSNIYIYYIKYLIFNILILSVTTLFVAPEHFNLVEFLCFFYPLREKINAASLRLCELFLTTEFTEERDFEILISL